MTRENAGSIRGVVVPVLTPLTEAGELDERGMRRLLDRLIAAKVHGLFVGGTAGLGPLLPDDRWRRLMHLAREHVGGSLPLLAGVMETSTPRALLRVEQLADLGYEWFVLTPTFYLPARSDGELLDHFAACRDASAMEMVVYNIPACTGTAVSEPAMTRMIGEGWTRTVKDSSGDDEAFARLCDLAREADAAILQGNRPDLSRLAKIGAAGMVPVPANIVPEPFVAGWNAVEVGDEAPIGEAGRRIAELWDLLVGPSGDWIGGTTWALGEMGIGCGRPIAPLHAAGREHRAAVASRLNDLLADDTRNGKA